MTSRLFFACFLIGFSSIHGSPTYDVADFGAAGDNTTDDTLAFEAAIDAIAASGAPGTLLVPSGGVFLIRPINLTSNMVFHIQSGATVCGVMNDSLWPLIPPLPSYGQGRDHPGPRFTSLLHGERLENVTVSGDGHNNNGDDGSSSSVLDGQGGYWWGLRAAGQEVLLSNCSICVLCQTEVSYQARNWGYYDGGAPVLINLTFHSGVHSGQFGRVHVVQKRDSSRLDAAQQSLLDDPLLRLRRGNRHFEFVCFA